MRLQLSMSAFMLITIAGAAGLYLAPSHKEVALMRLEDRNFNEALVYYKEQQAKGDKSINILAPLVKIYTHYGYPDKAITLMESYVEENPRSVEGRKQLTSLYKNSLYYFKYCESLEILQRLSPSTANLRELTNTYRFLGKYPEEMAALAKLVQSSLYHPEEEDYVRLASLYMVGHKHDTEAMQTLVDFFNKGTKDISISTAHMAVQLLSENGQEKKALAIAKSFLKKVKREEREDDAIVLSGVFHRKNKLDESYKILIPYLDNVDNSPELLQRIVEIKLARKQDKEVYEDLSKRFEKGKLPELVEVSLLDLAIQYNNLKLVENVLKKASIAKMDEDSLIRFADKTSEMKRPDLAILIKNQLGKDYLRSSPFLAAILDVAEKGTPESIAALAKLPPNLVAIPERKLILASTYLRYNHPELAFSIIDNMPLKDTFLVIDPTQLAEIYLSMNKAESGLQRINTASEEASQELKPLIENTSFLLNVGKGDSEKTDKWLKNHKDAKVAFIADAYSIASLYKHYPIALTLAERVYKLEPKPQYQLELAEVLMLNSHYDDALKLLKPLAEKDATARSVYLNGMADWIRKAGIDSNDAAKTKLDVFLTEMLKRNDLILDEKRDIAYLLAETGFKDKAEDIFIEVAGNQNFTSHDVSELLGFWGETLTPKAVAWVTKKATVTSGMEKALWLSYANDIGHPQIVLAALNGSEKNLPAPVTDEYINALVATHNFTKLGEVISSEVAAEANAKRITKLATIAVQENLPDVSIKGWRKLIEVDPENSDAQRELGLLAFSQNHFTEAQGLLGKYLQNNKGEYRVNYAYGEILLHKGKPKIATQYFVAAQEQLASIPNKEKDLDVEITEASLLYRTNRVDESFDLYRRLLAKYPTNNSLRADFIQVLIDNKQFKEASLLLNK